MAQGSARTSLRNTNCTAGAAICGQIASDVEAERQSVNRKISDKAEIFPVATIGISYHY